MADGPGIPQTVDFRGAAPSGAAVDDPNHVQTSKKQRLVKNDAVMEFIANTIQANWESLAFF
jgi:hypothetical protein